MPASAVAINPVAIATSPKGATYAETGVDASTGNKFLNPTGAATILHMRNTQAGAIVVDFYADTPEGNEIKVMSVSIPGSATANGYKRLGPFPPSRYNNHDTTEIASTGYVILKPASGSTGDLKACVEPLPAGLLQG